ncbi:MAG: hypothetical protein ACLFU8_12860 [Anaerolineales bacterium]
MGNAGHLHPGVEEGGDPAAQRRRGLQRLEARRQGDAGRTARAW